MGIPVGHGKLSGVLHLSQSTLTQPPLNNVKALVENWVDINYIGHSSVSRELPAPRARKRGMRCPSSPLTLLGSPCVHPQYGANSRQLLGAVAPERPAQPASAKWKVCLGRPWSARSSRTNQEKEELQWPTTMSAWVRISKSASASCSEW